VAPPTKKFSLSGKKKATPQVPDEENEEQLKTVCALAREATSASTKRMSSLYLRALRKRIVAAPNDPDAAETGVPGKYDSSRYFTVSPLLGLFPCSIEVISTLTS
jgi:hypothetical protein